MNRKNSVSEISVKLPHKSRKNLFLPVFICGLIALILIAVWFQNIPARKVVAADSTDEIENAIYVKQDFFGAAASVKLPTVQARENIALLAADSPENPLILIKLAELDEKLGRFYEAEKSLIRLSEIDTSKIEALAAFYERRGDFQRHAEVLRKILFTTEPVNRAAVFERLIDAARIHDLKQYLKPAFYEQVTRENPDTFDIFQRLSDKLAEEENYTEALKYVRQAKQMFPEKQSILLEKENEMLLATNQLKEAETVYIQAFDPFWSEDEAEKFYDFLSRQDRLREYGAELKARFKKNPADFEAGVRLALFQNHDYRYGNDDIAPIMAQIEAAKKDWTTLELVTAARLLLQENQSETASRFLYTLYLREDFQKNSAQRAAISYQLFKMFSDAEDQKLPLANGDLRFYEDVAESDTNPGITTGILSLVFSDTDPRSHLDMQENAAAQHFNRAAAYRIFDEYKKENPNSDELAQMSLDIVRLYTAAKETEIARQTLDEFAARHEDSVDFPSAALKLADAYSATEQEPKARDTYQKILDYIGKQNKPLAPPRTVNEKKPNDLNDFSAHIKPAVTYSEVLEKYVGSLARAKQTPEILALYSNEIAKYPNEEWLYEKRLVWLEQSNLTDEKLRFYETSLARFQTNKWRDKLARFFVREERADDFTDFSKDLVGKLNDAEVQNYLTRFIDGKSSGKDFEKQLYLELYRSAHRRFPHNIGFVNGLLNFYKLNKLPDEWRELSAAYYFESPEIRETFLDYLAENGELRNYLQAARNKDGAIYELFRANVYTRLSDYENAVAAYRNLNQDYPNETEYAERLIVLTRSFGQEDRASLIEAAEMARAQAEYERGSAVYRTRSGEIFAELGSYPDARVEWEKIIETASGSREIYLDTATVYWDYFQFDDARRTIEQLRVKFGDRTAYAFETGAILEGQGQESAAISEYVKALDNRDDEDDERTSKAVKRLKTLNERNPETARTIDAAYENEKRQRTDSSFLSLGYAEFLSETRQSGKAEMILNRAMLQSRNIDFLEAAKDFYQSADNRRGEQIALKKLAETTDNPRRTIRYNLQLAGSFEENNQRAAAKNVLAKMVARFPTNYGVLTQTSTFYVRLGYEHEAAQVLEKALPRSRGAYRNALAQSLAERLIQVNRLDAAESILLKLHAEDAADADIFRELAGVLLRTNKPEAMRKAFDQTVKAIKSNSRDQRNIDDQIAKLREPMIEAFTKLKDYEAAIEQHIELINREPENVRLTDNAVAYVRRYGGAGKLLDYYLKLSAEAFKNYRWSVVLARIYESNNDLDNAAKNYEAAIVNQPEMVELYDTLADIETKRSNYDAALKNLDTILEITNGNTFYIKKKIEILKKAGRNEESEAEKAKLPPEDKKKIVVNEFEEARKTASSEKAKARELYRTAFGKLSGNPLNGELRSADISGYVEAMREEKPLDQISSELWNLRDMFIKIADESDATDAGEARKRLNILSGAMTDSIGGIAGSFGTDDELAELHEDLSRRINDVSTDLTRNLTISLIQDIANRAGFGDLEETILVRKADTSKTAEDTGFYAQSLINFYNERGAYRKTFDALEKYQSDNLPLKAETARLVGNREKELEAMRAIYRKPAEKLSAVNDANVARYFEIIYAENRVEMQSLTERSSAYQLQLINFLLGKGDKSLAHAAIENAGLSKAWTVSRHAETSLALREFDDTAECFFCDALQFVSIGEMVAAAPDKTGFLINDDWFLLTREYGEWLGEKDGWRTNFEAANYLSAMTENTPQDAGEQFKLGVFYLDKKDANRAVEHLRLASEMSSENKILVNLGAAYYLANKKDAAEAAWNRVFEDGDKLIETCLHYFQTLQKYGLSDKARSKLSPFITRFLALNNADNSAAFQDLIRAVAGSLLNEAEKAAYFRKVLQNRPTDVSLAAMLVNENLIARERQSEFYELLIVRSKGMDSYDTNYEFESVRERLWNAADAEAVYWQETEFKMPEPEAVRLEWQRKYLGLLFERSENAAAARLIAEIERDINNRYVRPKWLVTAKIRHLIRDGKPATKEIESYVGITVPDAAAKIIPPNVERFNDVAKVLKEEGKSEIAAQISEAFFARRLALEQFDAANFAGLARFYFQKGESEKALRILNLMIDAGDETKSETAAATVAAMEIIKARAADATKTQLAAFNFNRLHALKIASELAAEFNQNDASITFRQQLLEANPSDFVNKIELAEILLANNDSQTANDILTQVANDKNSPRSTRWQARMLLSAEIANRKFDSFSQFYVGSIALKSNQTGAAANFFVSSLIADKDAAVSAKQSLIKVYALDDKPFAALKFEETDQNTKPDALLQLLSEAAEKVSDFSKAIDFEFLKSDGGNKTRVADLKNKRIEQNKRATYFSIDAENTKNL